MIILVYSWLRKIYIIKITEVLKERRSNNENQIIKSTSYRHIYFIQSLHILLILLAAIMITVKKKIYSTTTMTEKEVDQSKHWSNMFFRTPTSQQMNFTEEQWERTQIWLAIAVTARCQQQLMAVKEEVSNKKLDRGCVHQYLITVRPWFEVFLWYIHHIIT